MNVTNLLLGTISLLLVVGFALFFGDFQNKKNGSDAVARREERLRELRELEDRERKIKEEILVSNRLNQGYSTFPQPPSLPPSVPAASANGQPPLADSNAQDNKALEELRRINQALEAEKAEAEAALAEAEKKAELSTRELEANNQEKLNAKQEMQARVKKINESIKMGTVTNANQETALVIFEPTEHANFDPGKILNIRRNGGIVGEIVVDRLDSDKNLYIATMRPSGFTESGYPDVVAGDEIIVKHDGL